ncbi:MAG TPA: ATP-binding protein [Anaeromyxobacteraceae bacterium]|nr:ATP-binding protein [Anaeromyxobacteraceae bacterium]
MTTSEDEIARSWAAWRLRRNRRGLRAGVIFMITLYPAFGLLDWALAPHSALPWLWGTRACIGLLAIVILVLMRRPWFDAWVDRVAVLSGWLAAVGISIMTAYMGGMASPYYAGLILVVLAAGLLFVWPPSLVAVTLVGVVASFPVVNLLLGSVGDWHVAVSNITFLSTTAIIAGVAQVLLFATLREQHEQRLRLEVTTQNLERAHTRLQQLDEFKSRFFANMTHELRTPLAMVLTPLELMMQGEMGAFSEPQRSSLQTMYRSALKLLKLINDLLDLSRLEESRLRLEVKDHDLGAQLAALVDQTQVLARRKSIALVFHRPASPVGIACDAERMERVFVNLLSNAIKFTPVGGHVTVTLEDDFDDVRAIFEDDGPGFPPGQAEQLFERFYQVDMADRRQHGGAGIGLALARELVVLHGGEITAESDGRSGSRFTVTLRKGRAHFRPEVLAAAPAEAAAGSGEAGLDWAVQLASRSEFRLLDIEEATERRVVERDQDEGARPYTAVVVEDHPHIVQLVHMSLRRQFKVLTAADGLKGLELVLRERPSLVVTDLMMPGIDGLALTRRLREEPSTRHIPIIMLTARGELDDRVKGLETGVNAYLTKPFSPKELLTAARELVKAKEQTADLVLTQRMESLEMVAAGLAHEINNPLNYLKNALGRVRLDADKVLALCAGAGERPLGAEEAAQVEKLRGRIHELLGVADSGVKRIGSTVELMSRYGRAGYKREMVPHDAWAAARTVVGIVLPATGRHVQVDVDVEGDGTLECVPEEFNQVLSNLVQNAIEAVPDETGRVRVRGRVEDGELVVSVKDNGPGIPPDVLQKLFTPFFSTKGPGRGVGLGLTITRRVVQALGGTLQVASVVGEGTEFTARLPRTQPRPRTSPVAGG